MQRAVDGAGRVRAARARGARPGRDGPTSAVTVSDAAALLGAVGRRTSLDRAWTNCCAARPGLGRRRPPAPGQLGARVRSAPTRRARPPGRAAAAPGPRRPARAGAAHARAAAGRAAARRRGGRRGARRSATGVAELIAAAATPPSATSSTGWPPGPPVGRCGRVAPRRRPAARPSPWSMRGPARPDRRADRRTAPRGRHGAARRPARRAVEPQPPHDRRRRARAGRARPRSAPPRSSRRCGSSTRWPTPGRRTRRPSCAPAASGCATCAARPAISGVDEATVGADRRDGRRGRAAQRDPRPRAGLPADRRVRHLARAATPPRAGPTWRSAWLAMTRQPSLVSQRGERDRLITAARPGRRARHHPGAAQPGAGHPRRAAAGQRARPAATQVLDRLAWHAAAAGQRAASARRGRPRRGRPARRHGRRRPHRLQPHPARRQPGGRRAGARRRAARAGRPLPRPARPDRRRSRPARRPTWPPNSR